MTANHNPGNADADLVRYLDGELSAEERARVEAHLATDAALADRFAALKRRSTRLGALLAAVAPSAAETAAADPTRATRPARHPEQRRVGRPVAWRPGAQSGWLKAAIVIIAISLGAVLVPPVRAWIVHQLQRLAPTQAAAPPAVAPATGPQLEPGVLDLEFDVGPSATFEITIEREQAGGELRIRSADAERASATRTGGDGAEEMLVSSGGLKISNVETSTASYEVVMPARVRRVVVRVGSRPELVIELDGSGSSRTVPIGPTTTSSPF